MEYAIKRTRKADVSYFSNGKIDIRSNVTKSLGLAPGDCINIAYDGVECYLFKAQTAGEYIGYHTAQCHSPHRVSAAGGGAFLRVWSVALTRFLHEITGHESASMRCGELTDVPEIGRAIPLIFRI